jgi:hypothetical protein
MWCPGLVGTRCVLRSAARGVMQYQLRLSQWPTDSNIRIGGQVLTMIGPMDNIIRYITGNTTTPMTERCTQERSSAHTTARLANQASQCNPFPITWPWKFFDARLTECE